MSKRKRIGVYGGTFDPIHRGHMAAAETACAVLGLDLLLLIPDRVPPHKELSGSSAAPEHRLEMARLAGDRLKVECPVKVLELELNRKGKSYTSDTLRALKKKYPGDELWLLMGTDMFLTLHLWHEPEVIFKLANICAFGRTEQDGEAVFAPQRDYLTRHYQVTAVTITLPGLMEISSTELREKLAAGERPEELDESVYGYILRHRLYGTHADLTRLEDDDLRACSYSMIRAKRIPHVRGCEEEAVKLARRWGADPEQARKAAILHDCTKYLTLEEQLSLCEKYGIMLDDLERTALKLLHSKTGAAIAKYEYGMPEEICSAIFYHTTGRADMTLLEKILYIADYMEPSRDFDGVEQLRKLVYRDLNAAVRLGLEMTMEEMKGYGSPVHEKTLEALDFLRKETDNGSIR